MFTIAQLIALGLMKSKKKTHFSVIKGKNTILQLADTIIANGYKSVFIVSSRTVSNNGMLEKFLHILTKECIKNVVFTDLQSDPSIENVEDGVRICNRHNCDCVVAVGGGSVLDCAKTIALKITNPKIPVKALSVATRKSLPIFAVPTTSGTGSEATFYSVITDSKNKRKIAIISDKSLPKYVFFDTVIMSGVPSKATAYAGLDALVHAIESYISTFKKEFKRDTEKAPIACKLIFESLYTAYSQPQNYNARKNMAMASLYAGISFRYAGVGYVHSIAHRIGELYKIPHGLACAVILPYVLEHSLPQITDDLAMLAVKSGVIIDDSLTNREYALLFIREIRKLNQSLNIPSGFSEIDESDLSTIIERTQKEASFMGCPKMFNNRELKNIVLEIMNG